MDVIVKRQLTSCGHVQRMTHNRIPKRIMNWIPHRKNRGRPKKNVKLRYLEDNEEY